MIGWQKKAIQFTPSRACEQQQLFEIFSTPMAFVSMNERNLTAGAGAGKSPAEVLKTSAGHKVSVKIF